MYYDDRIFMMAPQNSSIQPVSISDALTITRMAHENMTGRDQQFTRLVANPFGRWASYFYLPLYFMMSGRGYKYVSGDQIAGCAYLHLRRSSGFIFNVNVNAPFRRQGVAQSLMGHVEEIAKNSGKSWVFLQVDQGNDPAKNLYTKLGYGPHNADVFTLQGEFGRIMDRNSDLRIESLPLFQGKSLYKQYQTAELGRELASALDVIEEYDADRRIARAYWRCLFRDEVIGCVLDSGSRRQPFLHILLSEAYWEEPLLKDLIAAITSDLSPSFSRLDVAFGSSRHSNIGQNTLMNMGFEKWTKPRLLMYKSLLDKQVE